MALFDFLNAINYSKKVEVYSEDPLAQKEYKPFVINRFLSQNSDSILYVNEMNQRPHCDSELQFHYFINSLRKKKRIAKKWYKSELSDDIECIQEYFNYNIKKAQEALMILSNEDLSYMKDRLNKGGVGNDRRYD